MTVIEMVSSKSFAQLWRELRKLGLKAKKPTGLGVDFHYIPPNGSLSGEEGRDFFTGDEALMKFARRRRLLRLDVVLTEAIVNAALADPFTMMNSSNTIPTATAGSTAATATVTLVPTSAAHLSAPPVVGDAEPPRTRRKTTQRVHERLGRLPGVTGAITSQVRGEKAPDTAQVQPEQTEATAQDTAQPRSTAEEPTAEDTATAQTTVHDDISLFDSASFLRAMQDEEYFGNIDDTDVNLTKAPIEDNEDSEPEEESAIVDMAIVNGYIIHRFVKREQSKPVPTHAEYIMRLHQELLAVTKVDMLSHPVAENLVAAPAEASEHSLTQTMEIYKGKLRQYLCKVCSALSDKNQRSSETLFFCAACGRARGGSVWLRNKVRPGQTLTCSQIWQKNGTLIPTELRGKIRFCKRKRGSTEEEQEDISNDQ